MECVLSQNTDLRYPLTAERLQSLLFSKPPRVYWFEAGQTHDEWVTMMASIPAIPQKIAHLIMVNGILHYLGYLSDPEYADKPLLWYMGTKTKPTLSMPMRPKMHASIQKIGD